MMKDQSKVMLEQMFGAGRPRTDIRAQIWEYYQSLIKFPYCI